MKRRGFTLIELMVVIAIIIILAAIAIPNYLSMTARAKRSRVASDFAAIATSLETYRTDWNQYPVATKELFGAKVVTTAGSFFNELTSTTGEDAATSVNKGTTAAGDVGPIQYMTPSILKSMINPYTNVDTDEYQYTGTLSATGGKTHWMLVAPTEKGNLTTNLVYRTDEMTLLTDAAAIADCKIPTD